MVDAAQDAADDGSSGARDPRNERRALPESDDNRVPPGKAGDGAMDRLLAAAPQFLAHHEQDPVQDQEDRSHLGRAEQAPQEALEQEAKDHCGTCRQDDEQSYMAALANRVCSSDTQHAAGQSQPVAPKIQEQGEGGSKVQGYKEGQEGWPALVDMPVQDGRNDDRVCQAADRKQLRDALQDRDDKRLNRRHVAGSRPLMKPGVAAVLASLQAATVDLARCRVKDPG